MLPNTGTHVREPALAIYDPLSSASYFNESAAHAEIDCSVLQPSSINQARNSLMYGLWPAEDFVFA